MAGTGFGDNFFEEVLGTANASIRNFVSALPSPSSAPSPSGVGFGRPYAAPESSRNLFSFLPPEPFAPGALSMARTRGQTPSGSEVVPGEGKIAAARRRANEAKTGAIGTGGEDDLFVDTTSPNYALAVEAAKAENLDPRIFTRLVAQESKYNPRALNQKSGAAGLTGLMPDTARELGVTDVYDPQQALRGGAHYLRQMLDKFGGDYTLALAAYNAGPGRVEQYGGVPPFGETASYVRRVMAAPNPAAPISPAEQAQNTPTAPGPGERPLQGLTTAQYGSESLATGAADYICGPIAAQAFVRTQGRNPTLRESLDMARQLGLIDAGSGMHGVEATAQLIRKLGGQARVGQVDKATIIREVSAGRPVIMDTNAGSRGHYFVVEGYDPTTGKFDLGNSAKALRASQGRQMFTLEEIASLGFGSPHAAIYAT